MTWQSYAPHLWFAVDPQPDIPADLVTPGFVLVLGVRVTNEDALVDALRRLDGAHAHPAAFTLASGGLYCDLGGAVATDPLVAVDLSLPRGLHTQWLDTQWLAGRPALREEAHRTAAQVHAALGYLAAFIHSGSPIPHNLDDARVPPLLQAALRVAGASPTDAREARRVARTLMRTVFHGSDLFDATALSPPMPARVNP